MTQNKKRLWAIMIVLILGLGSAGAYQYIEQNRLNKMVGQMILVGFRGTTPNDIEVKELAHDIEKGYVGGVILFNVDIANAWAKGLKGAEVRKEIKSRNIQNVVQVQELNNYLSNAAAHGKQPPLFISIDQEGGIISRIVSEHGFDVNIPSARDIAKQYTPEQTRQLYSKLGNALHSLGFNIDFAPTVDVDVNPTSPAIGALGRSYSGNANTVIEYGRAAANGLSDAGVLYSYKHFPGHGSAAADTHEGLVDITKTWQESELEPYRQLVRDGMPGMVMVAHVMHMDLDSQNPASLSPKIINGLLREKIGYNGVVISDDLQMGAIYEHYGLRETLKKAILAGNDIMLLGNNLTYTPNLGRVAHGEIVSMVKKGEISKSQIQKSYKRIIELKQKIK